MGIQSAVQWWDDWQLRILVLSSLGVQCYLSFFASARKSHIRPLYRFSIWLSYLGGDALAIYALATLFNRQRKVKYSSIDGARDLEVLWAPILLMHLGGQINISAYNIEDNELWRRHIVTAVSQVRCDKLFQVVVAVYVFYKSWSSSADKRLLAAAILLFIPGIFKCFERPLALKRASINSLVSSSHPASRTETINREVELEQYIQEARDFVNSNEDHPILDVNGRSLHLEQLSRPDKLFVDIAYSYDDRLTSLKSFWLLDDEAAYEALRRGLSNIFDLLYTKDVSKPTGNRDEHLVDICCSLFTMIFTLLLPIAAIGLAHSSHKKTYKGSDVAVTFVLLYVTYFLELFSLGSLSEYKWHYMVAQHNLIRFFARNKRHTWLMCITGCLQCTDFVNQYWRMKPGYSSKDITSLVRGHVKDGWINYVLDAENYRKFSDIRGHWTLERNECVQALGGSLEKPFDESILLWHVATDFCFHHKDTSPYSKCASLCRQISNYTMHLLSANSDMLMPGSRRSLFTTAYSELEDILNGYDLPLLDEKKLVQKIVDNVESKEGFIKDAWVLAQELMKLGDEKMWEVIKGVWVEMLCFSAGRCRGYLHAKSLGSGGEYLSFVWLLMAHAGMETFPERQQRVQLRLSNDVRVNTAKQRIEETARKENADEQTVVEVVDL